MPVASPSQGRTPSTDAAGDGLVVGLRLRSRHNPGDVWILTQEARRPLRSLAFADLPPLVLVSPPLLASQLLLSLVRTALHLNPPSAPPQVVVACGSEGRSLKH